MSQPAQLLTSEISGKVPGIRFSLILATVGRTEELANFLVHLDAQPYRAVELIVVDQNEDDRLLPVLSPYQSRFFVKHIRSNRGISRARNLGLRFASGNIVAFPDDDCWYNPDTLQRVANLFFEHPDWDGITGSCTTPAGRLPFLDHKSGYINKINVWTRAISITIFLRDSLINTVGTFDERLGAGADSGFCAGEETDYLLRALENRCWISYQSDICVNHPEIRSSSDRGYVYGRGLGYVLRKHDYPLWYAVSVFFRPLLGAFVSLLSFNIGKARFYYSVLRGRLSGWLA